MPETLSETLSRFSTDFPVVIEMPVQWGDMDALQHVNNVAYFRYFESVRIAFMCRTSLFDSVSHVYPVLAATECRYKGAVTFPDTLKIGCRLTEYEDHGFQQSYGVYSCEQDRVTTLGSGRIVLLSSETGKKVPLNSQWRQELDAANTTGEK